MGSRAASWVAVLLGLSSVALVVSGVLFQGLVGFSSLTFVLDVLWVSVLVASFSVVGAIVASRRPANPLGWIFLAVAFSQGLSTFALPYGEYALQSEPGLALTGAEAMVFLVNVIWFPGFVLLFTYAPLLFPDGRLPSKRWRPVAWISAAPIAIFALSAPWLWTYQEQQNSESFLPGGLLGTLLNTMVPLALLCGLACIASVVVRFWGSRGMQRQQIKWFAYAIAAVLTVQVLSDYLFDGAIGNLLMLLAAPTVPAAVGIAVLKHRLYDIDLLINRTLVYGSLTVSLALVYVGGVVGLQALLRAITGQESTLAVVASTLAIAALFGPLRRRLQAFVDRRFYREKYDAAIVFAAFNARLREETDLGALCDDLVGVAGATVQPEHVSLWLRPQTAPEDAPTD